MRSRPDERAWLYDGTLHVGAQTVELGEGVDQFVLGATGVYGMRGQTLMFTSAEGGTQEVEDVGWATWRCRRTGRCSRPWTSHVARPMSTAQVLQLAAFDTRTGEQLYRTPDEEPDGGDDLADLYGARSCRCCAG